MWQIWGRLVSQPSSNCVSSNQLVALCLFAIFAPVSGQDSCSVGPCYPSPLNISKHFNVTATQLAVTRQSNTALAWIALKFAMRPTRNVNILLTL